MPNLYQEGREVLGFIFRARITINGVTYYARDYGKRAFKIPIYR